MNRIIIIGTGVFGLSTADHVRKRYPDAQLSIVSQPSPLAPSDDISKVVRIDYSNPERMKEAIEAQRQWISDKTFDGTYRNIGRVVIYDQDDLATYRDINKARNELGLPERHQSGSELMKEQFGSTMAPESLGYVLNEDDGIVNFGPCISEARMRAKAACASSGGIFYESRVASLVQDDNRVTAIVLENGETIEAATAQLVLAVGPWLAQVLATSGIILPPGGRTPTATGLFSFNIQLNEKQAAYFRDKPMVTHNGKADFLPPASAHGTMGKITWVDPFTNLRGTDLSHVEDLSKSSLAKSHMSKAISWARTFVPLLQGAHVTSITSYWDGVTETQDPLVSRHPQLQNLVCASGGSFNRAKDLPTIGSVIVDVLNHHPVPDRFGWNPETKHSHHDQPRLAAGGDFAAMEKKAAAAMEEPVRMDVQEHFADQTYLAEI